MEGHKTLTLRIDERQNPVYNLQFHMTEGCQTRSCRGLHPGQDDSKLEPEGAAYMWQMKCG